jgi:hypothetical protein
VLAAATGYSTPTYLPWWHNRWDEWRGVRITSGCAMVEGLIRCTPESMRADAEKKLRQLGAWTEARPLPLSAYTLARYIAGEVGGGTPEELVAVAEAAVNQARRRTQSDINKLLIYLPSQAAAAVPSYGYYGKIHGDPPLCTRLGLGKPAPKPETCTAYGLPSTCLVGCAPFGRWATTSQDPTAAHVLIAQFVLDGHSRDFARGANDQFGPESAVGFGNDLRLWVEKLARSEAYWVGLLPGVDHWRTLLFRTVPEIPSDSPQARSAVSAALEALAAGHPDWSRLPVAAPGASVGKSPAKAIAGIAALLAFSAGVGLLAARYAEAGNWNWLKLWRRTA